MSFDDVNQSREMIAIMRLFQLMPGAYGDEMKEFSAQVIENKKGKDSRAKCERPKDGYAKVVERLLRRTFEHVQRIENTSKASHLAK